MEFRLSSNTDSLRSVLFPNFTGTSWEVFGFPRSLANTVPQNLQCNGQLVFLMAQPHFAEYDLGALD